METLVQGGPLRKVAMDEWKEVMPSLLNKLEDAQIRKAFLASILNIYKKFEKRGSTYPPRYIMKMRK